MWRDLSSGGNVQTRHHPAWCDYAAFFTPSDLDSHQHYETGMLRGVHRIRLSAAIIVPMTTPSRSCRRHMTTTSSSVRRDMRPVTGPQDWFALDFQAL